MNEETLFYEIMQAVEKGLEEAQELVLKNSSCELRNLISSVGKVHAGCIGKAIVEVFKKHAEIKGE